MDKQTPEQDDLCANCGKAYHTHNLAPRAAKECSDGRNYFKSIESVYEEVVLIATLSDQTFTTGDVVFGQNMNGPEIFQYDSRIDYTTYYDAPLKKVTSKR